MPPRRSSSANKPSYRLSIPGAASMWADSTGGGATAFGVAEPVLSSPQKIIPDRLVAQGGDEGPMRLAVGIGDSWQERRITLSPRRIAGTLRPRLAGLRGQDQLRLPGPDQVDIDFGQQLRVEQRAVLGTAGIIDRIT